MGDWYITIRGRGPHHNKKGSDSDDVDKLGHEFVKRLQQKNAHSVLAATLATGKERVSLLEAPSEPEKPANSAESPAPAPKKPDL